MDMSSSYRFPASPPPFIPSYGAPSQQQQSHTLMQPRYPVFPPAASSSAPPLSSFFAFDSSCLYPHAISSAPSTTLTFFPPMGQGNTSSGSSCSPTNDSPPPTPAAEQTFSAFLPSNSNNDDQKPTLELHPPQPFAPSRRKQYTGLRLDIPPLALTAPSAVRARSTSTGSGLTTKEKADDRRERNRISKRVQRARQLDHLKSLQEQVEKQEEEIGELKALLKSKEEVVDMLWARLKEAGGA